MAGKQNADRALRFMHDVFTPEEFLSVWNLHPNR
jgi:hypothetical protein